MDMGAHARAAQAAELALALAPQVRDPALIARMHRQVARTMLAEGRYAEADASLAKAAELYRQLQIRTELANCHWMRGYLYAQQGELARAEAELREAHAMLSAKRAALYSSQVTVELADVLHRRGKSDEAAALLHDVLGDLSSERGAVHSAAAHRLLGIIAEDARDTEKAEEHYVRALSVLERAGAAGDLADLSPAARRSAAPDGPGGGRARRVPDGAGAPYGPRDDHPGPGTRTAASLTKGGQVVPGSVVPSSAGRLLAFSISAVLPPREWQRPRAAVARQGAPQ